MTSWQSVYIYILAALALSAPIGPLGVMALHKRYHGGRPAAYALAAGVIIADGVMTVMTTTLAPYFGSTLERLVQPTAPSNPAGVTLQQWGLRGLVTIVGLALLGVAVATLREPQPLAEVMRPTPRQRWNAVLMGFGMTLGNPGDVMSFFMTFLWLHSLGLSWPEQPAQVIALTVAVVAGTCLMWGMLLDVLAPLLARRVGWLTRRSREVTAVALLLAAALIVGRGWR